MNKCILFKICSTLINDSNNKERDLLASQTIKLVSEVDFLFVTYFLKAIILSRNSKNYEQDSKVQFVIDAVYAFAYGLQYMKQVNNIRVPNTNYISK